MWATKANSICTAGDAQMTAVQKQKNVDYAQVSAVSHNLISQLTALKAPAGEGASLHKANALLSRAMGLIDKTESLAAAKQNPLPTLTNGLTLMSQAFVTYNRLGATVCTTGS
jgi:hypothetical protein